MSGSGDFDVQGVISAALSEFFERILSMKVELDDGDLLAVLEGEGFVVTAAVTGNLSGRYEIKVGGEFALHMAASMLGGNLEDVDAEFEVPDLLGEMGAFLGRKLRELGSREGLSCEIGEPRVEPRDDMLSVSAPLQRGSRCLFRHGEHEGWVDFRLSVAEQSEEGTPGGRRVPDAQAPEAPPADVPATDAGGAATAQATAVVSDGEQSFDLELEPLEDGAGAEQEFAGLSEEDDLPDLMADITDTGEGAADPPGEAGGRRQVAPEASDVPGPDPGRRDPSEAETSPEDAAVEDFEPLSEKEADLEESPAAPDAGAPTEKPPLSTVKQTQSADCPTRPSDRETFVLRDDVDAPAASAVEDEPEAPARRHRGVFWLAAAMLAAVAAGGWLFMLHQRGGGQVQALRTAPEIETPAAPRPAGPLPTKAVHAPERPTATPTPQARLTHKIEEAGRLKDALLGKLEEVLRLKRYFQDGIEDVRSQLAVRIQNSGLRSYRQAVKDQRIELDLRTIQRRMAAIDELDRPIGWLANAAEAVDYGIRRTRIDLAMAPFTAGADLRRLYRELDLLTRRYALSDDRLLIDDQTVEARPLTAIWQEVVSPVRKVALVQGSGEKIRGAFMDWTGSADDRRIWKELCRGDFGHASRLTMISAEAAACLASDQVKDLFLGELRELSGAAARNLVKWPGRWLVLNGLRTISPATARQLARWRGVRLSLNGLVELSPQAAEALAGWGGRELEMVGLKAGDGRQARRILKSLGKWERDGRRLFLPAGLRRALDAMAGGGTGDRGGPAGARKG